MHSALLKAVCMHYRIVVALFKHTSDLANVAFPYVSTLTSVVDAPITERAALGAHDGVYNLVFILALSFIIITSATCHGIEVAVVKLF